MKLHEAKATYICKITQLHVHVKERLYFKKLGIEKGVCIHVLQNNKWYPMLIKYGNNSIAIGRNTAKKVEVEYV